MSHKDDGYIRIRCHECGKKLKARKEHAGQMFTCKACKTVNVLPFVIEADGTTQAPDQAVLPDVSSAASSEAVAAGTWAPQVKGQHTQIAEITSLLHAVCRCYQDSFSRVQNLLADPGQDEQAQRNALVEVKRDGSAEVRRAIRNSLDAMASSLAKLQSHPQAESPRMQEQIAEAIRQQRAFRLFVETVLGFKKS